MIVSNSLPAWLSLNNYNPFYGFGNAIQLYPSFLVPQNLPPPFGAVHVVPELTRAQMREKLAQLERELEVAKQPQLFDRALGQLMQGVANQVAADRLVATDTHSDQFGTFGVLGRSGDGNITFEPATLDEVWPDDAPKPPDTKVL